MLTLWSNITEKSGNGYTTDECHKMALFYATGFILSVLKQ